MKAKQSLANDVSQSIANSPIGHGSRIESPVITRSVGSEDQELGEVLIFPGMSRLNRRCCS